MADIARDNGRTEHFGARAPESVQIEALVAVLREARKEVATKRNESIGSPEWNRMIIDRGILIARIDAAIAMTET